MDFYTYSPLALRTAKEFPFASQFRHALLGMMTEAGELADAYKRFHVYGKDLDAVNTSEETADVLWYLNLLLSVLGSHPGVIQSKLDDSKGGTLMMMQHMLPRLSADADPFERSFYYLSGIMLFIAGIMVVSPEVIKADPLTVETLPDMVHDLFVCLRKLCVHEESIEGAMDRNIAKLAKRYGDKYSDQAALNRDTEAERVVLESATVTGDGSGTALPVLDGTVERVADTGIFASPNAADRHDGAI